MHGFAGQGSPTSRLARHEGEILCSAAEAFLKGVLESEVVVSLVSGPRGEPFGAIFDAGRDDETVRAHELTLAPVPSAERAVTLVHFAARSGRVGFALVPNGALTRTIDAAARLVREGFARGGAACLLLEDDPASTPEACPRRVAQQLGLPILEAADVAQLRELIDPAVRLSRASNVPFALVAHRDLLRSADTLVAEPNRIIDTVDAMLARRRRRRRPRLADSSDVLRLVRRLELNRATSLPSPGERVPVGFLAVGAAAAALAHLSSMLGLSRRVPVLQLVALEPVDDVAVSRLLGRCERVVVLEPRPGFAEAAVLAVAEAMRRAGERPATVWGRVLPPAEPGAAEAILAPDDAVNPSILARSTVHLLHMIRPGGRLASRFAPEPPVCEIVPPPRGRDSGARGASALLRRMAADADQWLRERAGPGAGGRTAPPSAFSIDGAPALLPRARSADESGTPPERIVNLETWTARRFRLEGPGAVRHAVRDGGAWIFLVAAIDDEDGPDPASLARSLVPADRTERVSVVTLGLDDAPEITEALREAALADRLSILVVRDATPARYDTAALERSLAEVDRLGFEPRQEVIWPIDRICATREPPEDEASAGRSEAEAMALRATLRVDRTARTPGRAGLRVSVRPLLEQVRVIRTRAPAGKWRRGGSSRLELPEPIHRTASQWRAHLAGYRGPAPGVVGRLLAEAGRRMGYTVRWVHDPTAVGEGWRAWVQILFTRARAGESAPPFLARTPFGEADLLIGLDPAEALRAIATDPVLRVAAESRTSAVVNTGRFHGESDTEEARAIAEQLVDVSRSATLPAQRLVEDVASACREWFHTDRVADVALLGAAFQLGLVPLGVDAIEGAAGAIEREGFGRTTEAFRFGRHLVTEQRLFSRPREEGSEDEVRVTGRLVHLRARSGRRGAVRGRRVAVALDESLAAMPGLTETDAGRQARRDFAFALARCFLWGGPEYAERYARLIVDLYRADRGETGRALTRCAILPLATVFLIRDVFFSTAVTTSDEHRRRIRRRLNVKPSREDQLERRHLVRVDVEGFGRRVRADVRTPDWVTAATAAIGRAVPARWRGSRRERELREYVVSLVERSAGGNAAMYEHHRRALHRLHWQAADDRLRGMALSEVRMLAEPETVVGGSGIEEPAIE